MNINSEFLYDIWNTTRESSWKSLEINLRQRWRETRGTEIDLLKRLLYFARKMDYSEEEFPRYFEYFFKMVRERA